MAGRTNSLVRATNRPRRVRGDSGETLFCATHGKEKRGHHLVTGSAESFVPQKATSASDFRPEQCAKKKAVVRDARFGLGFGGLRCPWGQRSSGGGGSATPRSPPETTTADAANRRGTRGDRQRHGGGPEAPGRKASGRAASGRAAPGRAAPGQAAPHANAAPGRFDASGPPAGAYATAGTRPRDYLLARERRGSRGRRYKPGARGLL